MKFRVEPVASRRIPRLLAAIPRHANSAIRPWCHSASSLPVTTREDAPWPAHHTCVISARRTANVLLRQTTWLCRHRGHLPRAAAPSRRYPICRRRVCNSDGVFERCAPSTSLSVVHASASSMERIAVGLQRNRVSMSCPRLYVEELCSATLALAGSVVSPSSGNLVDAWGVTLNVLQRTVAPPPPILPSSKGAASVGAEEEVAYWNCQLEPLSRVLQCAISARFGSRSSSTQVSMDLIEVLLSCLCQIVTWPDAEATCTVTSLLKDLWRSWPTAGQDGGVPPVSMEVAVQRLVEAASPALLPLVVSSLLTGRSKTREGDKAADAEEEFLCDGRRWHPQITCGAVRVCLHRIVQVLTSSADGKQHGKGASGMVIGPVWRRQLQCCCLCPVPRHFDPRARREIAMLAMTGLKYAPLPTLLVAYQYFRNEGILSFRVADRFLAHCGVCVVDVRQRGLSLTASLSPAVTSAVVDAVLHARDTVAQNHRSTTQFLGATQYASAVLNALGFPTLVRTFFVTSAPSKALPSPPPVMMGESSHSVMSLVLLRDVAGAVSALGALGASRPEGWVYLAPFVVDVMGAVSRLVGHAGDVADVDALYAALVGFHNAGLFISHYVEYVLAGICDRISSLASQQGLPSVRPDSGAPPREVLQLVIPMIRATLRYVGDEVNPDIILELLETAIHLRLYAVPLAAALISTFRPFADVSLCLRELLFRVDSTTHHISFLCYYTLCYARDFGSADIFDHLASLWHVDGDAIWRRASQLAPSCKLWKCATCGRLNSDRFNYCLCSAMRFSHVFCGACGYAQDERLQQCRSCGQGMRGKASLAGAVARQAWSCHGCGARNPAKQMLLCFRCGQPTGPCFLQGPTTVTASGPVTSALMLPFCECHSTSVEKSGERSGTAPSLESGAYASAVGVCHSCGRFKMAHAARNTLVWVCAGCHQRRSTLERICPTCPQVECLPHAVCRNPVDVERECRHCHHLESNAFTRSCSACGSEGEAFWRSEEETAAATPAVKVEASAVATSTDTASQYQHHQPLTFHLCLHCLHTQTVKHTSSVRHQSCESCGASCERRGVAVLSVRSCARCGATVPTRYAGSAVCFICAAYAGPPPFQTETSEEDSGGREGRWTAVAIWHTCEVLQELGARDLDQPGGMLASASSAATPVADVARNLEGLSVVLQNSSGGATVAPFPRVSLQRSTMEATLLCLRGEWHKSVSTGSSEDRFVWLALRMDMTTLLGRLLGKLRPHLPTFPMARRLSALLKSMLTFIDGECGGAGARHTGRDSSGAPAHFSSLELCHECLGTHPNELCPFRVDGGLWTCESCGAANDNSDVCRYVCGGCLVLRPVMQDLLVSSCWECSSCARANVEFERYCIHCGLERRGWTVGLLPRAELSNDAMLCGDSRGDGLGVERNEGVCADLEDNADDPAEATKTPTAATESPHGLPLEVEYTSPLAASAKGELLKCETDGGLEVGFDGCFLSSCCRGRCCRMASSSLLISSDTVIPFVPTKCSLCGLVYVEARCPLCLNYIPDIADAKGTVCEVQTRCAFIQPCGTSRVGDRIFVKEALVRSTSLQEGLSVRYHAELGTNGRMQATVLQPLRAVDA